MVNELSQDRHLQVRRLYEKHCINCTTAKRYLQGRTISDLTKDSDVESQENHSNDNDGFCDTIGTSRDYLAKLLFWLVLLNLPVVFVQFPWVFQELVGGSNSGKQRKKSSDVRNQKLYLVILLSDYPIVIPDSEETLALAEESHSKMLSKHKDNMMLEKEKQVDTTPIDYMLEKKKQVDTTPIDYAALNQLYKDFPVLKENE
ncbi:hypothetical protein Tco_0232506 [Tanacetum coccineum]